MLLPECRYILDVTLLNAKIIHDELTKKPLSNREFRLLWLEDILAMINRNDFKTLSRHVPSFISTLVRAPRGTPSSPDFCGGSSVNRRKRTLCTICLHRDGHVKQLVSSWCGQCKAALCTPLTGSGNDCFARWHHDISMWSSRTQRRRTLKYA